VTSSFIPAPRRSSRCTEPSTLPDGGNLRSDRSRSAVVFTSAAYTYLVTFTNSPGCRGDRAHPIGDAVARMFSVAVDGGCSSVDCRVGGPPGAGRRSPATLRCAVHRLRPPGGPFGGRPVPGRAPRPRPQHRCQPGPDVDLLTAGSGGSSGPVAPQGPGLGGHSTGGCSAVVSSTGPVVAALAVLLLLAGWRSRQPRR
jgi:hypothetical protein